MAAEPSAQAVNEYRVPLWVWSGIDTVQSKVNYTLGTNLENLTLLSAGHIGTGNGDGNVLTGSTGADTLIGLDGNDTLDGGAGSNQLIGGGGITRISCARPRISRRCPAT